MLLLTNEDVVNALSIEECMAAVEESLRRLAQGKLVRSGRWYDRRTYRNRRLRSILQCSFPAGLGFGRGHGCMPVEFMGQRDG